MTDALRAFLRRQLDLRDESVPQFANRTGLNASGLYQILRGQRQYVADSTLDKIAKAFNMTPAEMASAMGRGGELTPEETSLLAAYRDAEPDKRPMAVTFLASLRRRTTANSPIYPTAKSREQAKREMQDKRRKQANSADDNPLTLGSHVVSAFAGLSRQRTLAGATR